jgi:hypothetical protein
MGAEVLGVPTTTHLPLSGQTSPVLAVVPNGTFDLGFITGVINYSLFITYVFKKSRLL